MGTLGGEQNVAQRSGQRPSAQAGAAGSEDRTTGARSNARSPRSDGTGPGARETFAEPSTATARVAPSSDTITSTQPAPAHLRRRFSRILSRPPGAGTGARRCDGSVVGTGTEPAGPRNRGRQSANSPLGVWLTKRKKQVRIEQCGSNLCGYSVDAKSNQNGEKVLINMSPEGQMERTNLRSNTGSTYDSTIALKGSDSLRVQGCAFGACSAAARPGAAELSAYL